MKILAGIVTFNPDIELLKRNIASTIIQVDYLVIVDNCSDNCNEIRKIQGYNILLIGNDSNRGIAVALNQIFDYALNKGFEWVLTLDQDTIIPDNMISEYNSFLNLENVGMLTCCINDRNLALQNRSQGERKYENVSYCITSGSLLRVEVWNKVNGFCEDMFIDCVDHDMNFNIIEHGYKILRVNNVVLNHAVGESKFVFSFGKKYQLYNESPLRNYYQFRNSIYLLKRHKKTLLNLYKYGVLGFTFSHFNRAYLICRYEDRSFQKFRMIVKGVVHGVMGKYGKYE